MAKSVLSAEHFHDKAAALAFIDARTWSMVRLARAVESGTGLVA